ncbi:hypothetical protein Trydic_g7173 [Trypoxylus dichotomus]
MPALFCQTFKTGTREYRDKIRAGGKRTVACPRQSVADNIEKANIDKPVGHLQRSGSSVLNGQTNTSNVYPAFI